MREYVIFTDSGCVIPRATLEEWGVRLLDLLVTFVGEETVYPDSALDPTAFYDRMRKGDMAKTSAINVEAFLEAFSEEAEKGKDILYLGFSSGLSATFHCAELAMKQLSEKYPEGKFLAVDSLAASAGQGLLLYSLVEMKKEGKSIEALATFAEERRCNVCHWFTVDNLDYLKRGGRVSPTVAFVGNLLGIKPVLHVDNQGHLINVGKSRGRKAALKALADKFGELAEDKENGTIFVSNADCMKDVEALEAMLLADYNRKIDRVVSIGAVIGSHAGPGTIAIFFYGKQR